MVKFMKKTEIRLKDEMTYIEQYVGYRLAKCQFVILRIMIILNRIPIVHTFLDIHFRNRNLKDGIYNEY